MKLSIVLFFFTMLLWRCGDTMVGYGYIYDFKKSIPLKGVKVYDIYNDIIYSDTSGYFFITYKIKKPDYLVFKKNGYVIDTIRTYGCNNAGETLIDCFKGQIVYLNQQNNTNH